MKNKILLSLLFIFLLCTGFRETEFMERTEYYKPDGTVHVCLEDESGNISPIFTLDDYIEGCYLDLLAPDLREGFESVSELLLEPSDCIDSMYHGIRFEF